MADGHLVQPWHDAGEGCQVVAVQVVAGVDAQTRVQCGLGENTCPEHAITLRPRLLLTRDAKQMRVLNEAAIFNCIGCGKPLGTQKMVEGMIAKLTGLALGIPDRAVHNRAGMEQTLEKLAAAV